MKKTVLFIVIIIILVLGGYFFISSRSDEPVDTPSEDIVEETNDIEGDETSTTTDEEMEGDEPETETTIGSSVEGRDITAYHFGEGETELLFIGGIHGGYSWNTALVAYDLMDHLEANPDAIPSNLKVTIVPVLNPDGLYNVVGVEGRFTTSDVPEGRDAAVPGRFNANEVDLNRNFDCDWQEEGTWQNRTVSGGSEAFSEPESKAIRDYVTSNTIAGSVVWYSAAGGVYASNCHNGIDPQTLELTNTYAEASGYDGFEEFDFYEITGDMVNWFASEEIPAISVLLTSHENVEFEKNLAGIKALFELYSE